MSDEKQPKIRFRGFADDWEQRKLKNVAPLQRGFDLPKSQIHSGPFPVVFSNGIGAWHNQFKVAAPGVVTGRSGSIGNVLFISKNYWPHNTTLWVTNFFKNNPKFIYYLYQTVQLRRFATGSGVPTLNRNDVHAFFVCIPNPEEQDLIGVLMTNLDNLIAANQKKLDELKQLKKLLMQKIFSQEWRFKGFTDLWEQRKLGDVSEVKDSARISNSLWTNSGIPYLRSTDIKDNKISPQLFISQDTFKAYEGKTGAPQKGDLLFTSGGKVGTTIILTSNKPIYVQGGAVLYVKTSNPFSKLDGTYLNYYFHSLTMQEYIYSRSVGGTIQHFTLNPAINAKISFPSSKEQKLISETFKNLDHYIAANQRRLDQLKILKKFLMQNMFV